MDATFFLLGPGRAGSRQAVLERVVRLILLSLADVVRVLAAAISSHGIREKLAGVD